MNRYYVVIDDDQQKSTELKVRLRLTAKNNKRLIPNECFNILNPQQLPDIIRQPGKLADLLPTELDHSEIQPVFFIDLKLQSDHDDDGYILLNWIANRYGSRGIYILNSVLGDDDSCDRIDEGVVFYIFDQKHGRHGEFLQLLVTDQHIPDPFKKTGRKPSLQHDPTILKSRFRKDVMGYLLHSQNKIAPIQAFQEALNALRPQYSVIADRIQVIEKQVSEQSHTSPGVDDILKMINQWVNDH